MGRENPLYYAENLSRAYGAKIYLKREDLNHTGAHKINNVIGQMMLAKRMGKKKVIAETGAKLAKISLIHMFHLSNPPVLNFYKQKSLAKLITAFARDDAYRGATLFHYRNGANPSRQF